ncbi:MAG TPA: diaminopimelate decarboxylase [Candidatus Omnitrophota bacterium]|nr:diaminopimelate decarboxylase [Candidatus Omnitrophota bacterium]HPD85337.1 diaminopimelate decarboxylase [Candidatus Omnitrophota bacterium]HRZ04162.1 diaminopimelate decarboxylase [Candidatus Omnitrophota bacterium]
MHDFKFKNNELFCERVRVAAVARAVGTPFYLYSYKTLTDHFTKIQTAFRRIDPIICYAMKANDNLSIVKALLNKGAGLDIVSGGELRKAIQLNADPKKIVFASVGKTEEEIALAIQERILFLNVESVPELETIDRVARRLHTRPQVAIRVNPDVEAATHDFITTGTLKKKFGVDLRSTRQILRTQKRFPHVRINGLHIHIGSQITQAKPFIDAIKKTLGFIESLRREGIELEYLDIGGGLGIIYRDEKPQTARDFAAAVLPMLTRSNLKIIMEPGRFIVGNAGIFVTKVLYTKDNGYKKFLIVDGGMNDLIRPSLYGSYHEIVPVKKTTAAKIKVDVVGPICESGDFFAKERSLPKMANNTLLAIMSAGAYGYTMSSNYNARCHVAEVIARGNRFFVIRKRQGFADLIKNERMPEFLK